MLISVMLLCRPSALLKQFTEALNINETLLQGYSSPGFKALTVMPGFQVARALA